MKIRHSPLIPLLLIVVFMLIAANATLVTAATIPVTPANVMQLNQPLSHGQVAVYITRGSPSTAAETSTARYAFVNGPATPPMGTGSLHLKITPDTDPNLGSRVLAGTTDLGGTPLASITTLSYASYIVNQGSNPALAPVLILRVDLDGNGTQDNTLFFEPYYQPGAGNPAQNTWHTWNADKNTGLWWDNMGILSDPAGSYACNRTLQQIVDGVNPPGCSLSVSAYPNAKVWDGGNTPSAVILAGDSSGCCDWDMIEAYVDAFNTGVNLYDFEAPSTVYVDPAWAATPVLTASGIVAHRTPFGTAPFVATCPQVTPHYFGLDGFASEADVTAALGTDFAGQIVDCASVVVPTPVPTASTAVTVNAANAPLCSLIGGGTNSIVRATVADGTVPQGSVFCQVITENGTHIRSAAEIGVLSLIERGPIQAVEVFGLLHNGQSAPDFAVPVTICLAGSGQFVYLSALQAPRAVAILPSSASAGYICATIPDAGTVVLVP